MSQHSASTPWEALGTDDEARTAHLRRIVEAFYERVFPDAMIGFFFRGKDRARLIELEVQFTSRLLGGPARYVGRGMAEVHRPLGIFGGQFARRQQILRETLVTCNCPPEVAAAWLAHNERLRPQVTADPTGRCEPVDPPAIG